MKQDLKLNNDDDNVNVDVDNDNDAEVKPYKSLVTLKKWNPRITLVQTRWLSLTTSCEVVHCRKIITTLLTQFQNTDLLCSDET